MAWDQLWINKPHLAYAIIGGFTSIFSLISLFVKEKLYIGEATVATIVGIIFGPHALKLFDPSTWGNVDYITLEVSRIVLIVQIFAVGVELPKKYMLRHWLSVFYLLVPVMAAGWLICSCFIWKLVPSLSWVEALVVSGCITATDPVLASAVVGKGKFSKRVPGHLRNLLSAESGCNDGMAFPFTYLAIYLIRYTGSADEIFIHWFTRTVLYECVFGCILGTIIGYSGRHLIKFAETRNLIDRESFLVFYFVLALFCTGIGTILGSDDLLVAFSAGAAFAWDGWFAHKTEESHVSNVIDLLLNLAYFVYFGSIIPWNLYNVPDLGITPWKLVILALLVILFRRIPIMLMLKPLVPDIRTWREALFCGHFGPVGVGAIFTCIIARAELEHDSPTPLAELPAPGAENYVVVSVIWPVVTFLIIASIIVHGSSIAVFTLGKRLNTMAITMSYTTGNGNGPSWLSRLPRMDSGQSLSLRKVETTKNEPIGKLFRRPTTGATAAGRMKHRRKSNRPPPEAENIQIPEPVLQRPQRASESDIEEEINPDEHNIFQEGDHIIIEDRDGEVLTTINSAEADPSYFNTDPEKIQSPMDKLNIRKSNESLKFRDPERGGQPGRSREHAIAYQLDDEIFVENDEGEIIKRYRINRRNSQAQTPGGIYDRALSWVGIRRGNTMDGLHNAGATHNRKQQGQGEDEIEDEDEDLEMQRAESSANASSVSGSFFASPNGINTGELPKNFLTRRTSDGARIIPGRKPAPSISEDDEETPAERRRRLAALKGTSDTEDENISAEDEAYNADDDYQQGSQGFHNESNAEDAENIRKAQDKDNKTANQDLHHRVSFSDENEGRRRRRLSGQGIAEDSNTYEQRRSSSVSESNRDDNNNDNDNDHDGNGPSAPQRTTITWSESVKRKK
ncbi:Sodium/hydrogen exchanger family-domain-containing protein [Dipodascopsis uninucleata]